MDPYTRAMFGENAVHVGVNLIIQDGQDGQLVFVGQSKVQGRHPLCYTNTRTHALLLGDMVFRPRLVIGSDDFRGEGINGLLKSGFNMDRWVKGDVVLDPLGHVAALDRQLRK